MKKHYALLSAYYRQICSCYVPPRSHLSLVCFSSSSLGETSTRSFPNYLPKKPSIMDSELVHRISTIIKQRRFEPLRQILKPFEPKFRLDHLIWILMDIQKDYSLVLSFFEWSCIRRDPSLEARCILIHIAVAANDLKMAQNICREFWTKLETDGSISFSQFLEKELGVRWVMHSLCQLGNMKEAHDLIFKMESRGYILNAISYSTVINGYCNKGELQLMLKVSENMQRKGLKPNEFTFHSINLLLCKTGKLVEAEKVLREMMCQGIFPGNVVYTTLIDCFSTIGTIDVAFKICDELQSQRIVPDSITYTALICGLCQNEKVAEADKHFR